MKKSVLIAFLAAFPLLAQECPTRSGCPKAEAPKGCCAELTAEQKAERKAAHEARRAKMLEKFDTDKDGQLSDTEKEAMKAEFKKHHGPKGPRCHGPKGPRPELTTEQREAMKAKMLEKFDTDKDGQLSDTEKEAMKAEFKKPHGPQGPRCHGPQQCPCGTK